MGLTIVLYQDWTGSTVGSSAASRDCTDGSVDCDAASIRQRARGGIDHHGRNQRVSEIHRRGQRLYYKLNQRPWILREYDRGK
jgi:hypothetical protein